MTKRLEMPLQMILDIDIFDGWEIELIGPFQASAQNNYILFTVDYVSQWLEVVALQRNDTQMVVKFIKKNILNWLGHPK